MGDGCYWMGAAKCCKVLRVLQGCPLSEKVYLCTRETKTRRRSCATVPWAVVCVWLQLAIFLGRAYMSGCAASDRPVNFKRLELAPSCLQVAHRRTGLSYLGTERDLRRRRRLPLCYTVSIEARHSVLRAESQGKLRTVLQGSWYTDAKARRFQKSSPMILENSCSLPKRPLTPSPLPCISPFGPT